MKVVKMLKVIPILNQKTQNEKNLLLTEATTTWTATARPMMRIGR